MSERIATMHRESHRSLARKSAARRKPVQTEMFARAWGGARRGAGRKPKGERARVSHARRAELAARTPVHVTTRLQPGLPSLRRASELSVLMRAIRAAQDRSGLRVVHYSIQTNHLHLLVESQGRKSLALGIQGFLVRIARALNRLWQRVGKLFADRYHAHALRSPREVRNALVYVLQNVRKHGVAMNGVDGYSSGVWFDGWQEIPGLRARLEEIAGRLARLAAEIPTLPARGWLLAHGWKRSGAIRLCEQPASSRPLPRRPL